MKRNMGLADRTLRVGVALVVLLLYVTGMISGTVAIVLGVLALVFVLTSAAGTCPLYLPLGVDTRPASER